MSATLRIRAKEIDDKGSRSRGTLRIANPVIAVSAAARPNDIAAGMAAGFRVYLTEPTDVGELVALLNKMLGKPH